ncbi:MAG: Mu-like prophage major head subunit gpT family protein [Gammaproteobacteria bacterium]|nr:Mu-like prophage major head subunit gpT family protein [Gammaproteobacteria bacterium]
MAAITNANLAVLNTGFQTIFQNGLKSVEPQYQQIATVVTSNTASNTYGWLGEMPELIEWVGKRTIKDITSHDYAIINKLFESTIGVKRTDIEDDNLGIYNPLFSALGQRAAQHPDKLVFELLKAGTSTLCYDKQNFFDTDHPVYPNHDGTGSPETVSNFDDGTGAAWYLLDTKQALKPLIFQIRKPVEMTAMMGNNDENVFTEDKYRWGVRARHNVGFGFWQMAHCSKQELTEENLNAAIAKMQSRKADGGRLLDISPTLLVVPPSLRATALKLVKADTMANGQTNINKDVVDVLSTSRVM